MFWLVLWTLILVSLPVVLAACAWHLWGRAKALHEELTRQGRTLSEALELLSEVSAQRSRL